LMGKSCPLQSAQPLGAKPKDMILISDKKGSAILFPPISGVPTPTYKRRRVRQRLAVS